MSAQLLRRLIRHREERMWIHILARGVILVPLHPKSFLLCVKLSYLRSTAMILTCCKSNYVPFKAARVSAIHNKFLEFNSAFRQEIVSIPLLPNSSMFTQGVQSTSNTLSCYPEELNPISEIVDYLAELTSSPPTVPSTQLQPSHIEVIMSVLERWPPVANFPREFHILSVL